MRFIKHTIQLFLMMVVVVWLASPAQAMIVSQLHIEKIKIALDLGGDEIEAESEQGGTIIMGAFQPPSPAIMDDFTGDGHTFSLFTQPGPGGVPAPSATVDVGQKRITVDLRSLFAEVTGSLIPNGSAFINIGPQLDNITGTYNPNNGDFRISWVHLFDPNQAFLNGIAGEIDGQALLGNPVPLPASVLLFGTGLAGIVGIFRKKEVMRS